MNSVETRQTLTELIYRCNRHYELHEYDQMSLCYTDDAKYRNWRGDVVGREAILELMARRSRTRLVRHFIGNVQIGIDGQNEATGLCYVTAYINHQGDPLVRSVPQIGPPAIAEYHFRFRRVGDQWLIAEKVTVEVFSGMRLELAGDSSASVLNINP